MSGEPVVYRDKIKVGLGFHLLLFLALLIPLAALGSLLWASASTGQPLPLTAYIAPLAISVLMSLIWILFSVLRVTVTARSVYIQYGLFGPHIPLDRITRCEAATYDWKRYGGWGIRRGADGSKAYNIMGDAGRAVRIVWRDDRGKEQVYLIASPNPEALAAAIQRARLSRSGTLPAPIEGAQAHTDDADALAREAEAELEAELAELAEDTARQSGTRRVKGRPG
ncbi:DUF3093 family protein [Chondromyces apiculatus]|uniref:PH domain-containing protein n=1 Tax=Chondromyces apiculatus DSM 436 TaxID=1192034 RepID=A0A017THP3_9BACT|nr:DUF3093 family protein [Chondromyces apiculatus]EYF08803.1 Hypothetical protein CAP_2664 [Chondromyces apiculatus DSM 436]